MNGRMNHIISTLPRGGTRHNRAILSVDYHECTEQLLDDIEAQLGPGEMNWSDPHAWLHWDMDGIYVNAFYPQGGKK